MKTKQKNILTAALLALSVALITVGVAAGQPALVMQKAVQVCLECIGIG